MNAILVTSAVVVNHLLAFNDMTFLRSWKCFDNFGYGFVDFRNFHGYNVGPIRNLLLV